jgi:geranylgeranyl diphosphate synthase type II
LAHTLARLTQGQVSEVRTSFDANRTVEDYYEAISGKTAALMAAACRVGGLTSGQSGQDLEALTEYGMSLGLIFQLRDDILDITSTKEKLGKSIGKDQSSGKATYPRLLGLAGAQKEADRLTATARAALRPLGSSAAPLLAIADTLLRRDH